MAWYNLFMTKKERALISAAKKLHARLSAIHESTDWKSAWVYLAVHGYEYKGPTYSKEFQALEDAIWDLKEKENKQDGRN